jgi:CheY-like chemotaxis protein
VDVEQAANGDEAWQRIAKQMPDLVVLDVHMPGVDGLQWLSIFRMRGDAAAVPVIVLTADADRLFVAEALRLGVRHYVLKSRFSLPDLLRRVAECLKDAPPPAA